MATIEKLFVQIFDRKRSIIDNLKQQSHLYSQHLVSKILIHGISPPPSLFTPDFSDDFSVLNKEELISGLLLPQPRSVVSYTDGLSVFHDKPVGKEVESGLRNELHATMCASSNGDDEVDEIAPQHTVDGPEKNSGTFPPCHVDGTDDMPSYIPMSPEEQADTVISSTYSKAEESLARIQRSKSRQKALELRNSGKTSAKSRFGREGDNHSHGKETRMNGQQLDDLRESVELVEPLAFSSKTCTKEAAVIGDCAHDTQGSDTCCNSRSQTTSHELREVQMRDDEMMEKSNDYRVLAESRSSFPLSIVGDYLENDKMTRCRNTETQQVNADHLQNGRDTKPSSDYMHSINEEQVIKNTEAYRGRVTRSRSGTEEAICGQQNHSKSQEVFIGRMTRSRSGKAQQPHVFVSEKEKVVRSHNCSKLSISEHLANRNSKACSGKITRSQRSWAKNGLSVLPKQLDFDEAEETCLADIQTEDQGISEEKRTSPSVQENFVSLRCSLSTETTAKSLSCEKLEGCSRESAQLSFIGDRVLGKNLVSADCPDDLQVTDEHQLGNSVEFDKDATLSRINGYSYQNHTIEPEGGQTLGKEATRFGLMDIHTDKTINLHRATSGASVTLLKIQYELSSGSVHNKSSQDRTIDCGQSSSDKASARSLNSIPDFLPATTSNEAKSECAPNMKVDCQSTTGGLETSCVSNYDGCVGSKSEKFPAGLNVLPDYNYKSAIDGSYPCYKRRKVGYQLNSKSASPSVRLNLVSAVNKSVQGKSSENNQGARTTLSDGHQLTLNVQHDEDNVSLGGSAMELFTSDNTQSSISRVSKMKTAEPSYSFSDKTIAPVEPISAIRCSTRVCGDLDPSKDVADGYSEEKIDFTEIAEDHKHSLQGVGKLKFSFGSPLIERMDVSLSDVGDVPEYESFIVSGERESVQNGRDGIIQDARSYLSSTTDDTSLLGQMCRSASLSTPSPFPTGYKFHQLPGVYHSVPNRFLENIDLGSNELVGGSALRAKSYSYHSFPSIRPERGTAKPYISPIGKGFDGITSKSGGSGKQISGNVELICFPIKEDPESSDEGVNVNDVVDTSTNEVDSAMRNYSAREPLRGITSNNEGTTDPSQAVLRSSADSMRSEICVNEIPNKDCKKNELRQSNRLRRRPGKENQSLSIGANSLRKHFESLSSRNSKRNLSGKSSLQSTGQRLSEKEPKRNNIVSNVKSFLPIVQQKQAAVALPAKREVKVKALEAAEAAKRLAEKRENERKQKKEAMKLERSRLEQENMKQMVLKKKLKEEEKKKRDVENAEKKRQREEEEKKEKEKKRRRIGEARVQQQRAEEKLHVWREESRCETEDGKAYERKDSNNRKENQDDRAKEQNVLKKSSSKLLQNDKIDAAQMIMNDNKASTGSSDTVQAGSVDVAEISTPNVEKEFQFAKQTSREQSYAISPYQCSDDEEDEEDVPIKKFVPTWASKSNVEVALSSLKQLDADNIFPPEILCSLEEVLLPRRLNTKVTVK